MDFNQQIVQYLKESVSENDLHEQLDNEIPNWLDDEWQDSGYDNEYDWYCDYCNGEAEDVVRNELAAEIRANIANIPEDFDIDSIIRKQYEFLDKA